MRDGMSLADIPEPVRTGVVGCALVHERRNAVLHDAVKNVRVAGDPPDIRRAPVDVAVLQVEDRFRGGGGVGQVAAGRVQED